MSSREYVFQGLTNFDTTAITSFTTGSIVAYGGLVINNTTAATGETNGAFVVRGGVGISGTLRATDSYFSGIQHVTNTIESSGLGVGGFILDGGASITKNLYVGGNTVISGNLNVLGTTTSIISTTVSIADNTFQLNSGPTGTRDSGILIQRYQVDNDAGTGDVVTDTAATSGTFGTGNTTTLVTLPAGFSAVDDAYNGWWLKVTSGLENTKVRQITDYNGTTKVATLSSALATAPVDSTDTFSLYNKSFVATYFDTAANEYVLGYTSTNTDITSDIYNSGYANVRSLGLYATNSTITNLVATTMSAGSLTFSNATIASLVVTGTSSIANLFVTNETCTNLVVNTVNITPNVGDIGKEVSFTAANNQSSPAAVTGLAFSNATVRSFIATLGATILTTADADNRYAQITLQGVQGLTGWVINEKNVGDHNGLRFTISTGGQVLYTSTNISGFLSDTLKFKAVTTTA